MANRPSTTCLPAQRHQIAKDAEHLRGCESIQAAGRLIREDYRGIIGQRTCDGDTLPLSAGQLIGSLAAMVAKSEPTPIAPRRGGRRLATTVLPARASAAPHSR